MDDFLAQLATLKERLAGRRVVVGFDGFIDAIVRPVRQGAVGHNPEYFRLLGDFGGFVSSRGGKSGSVELELVSERIGGNAPNTAAGLLALGADARLLAALGYPAAHPLFQEAFPAKIMLSVAQPGQGFALEFEDGKLMFFINGDLNALDWDTLLNRAGKEALANLYASVAMAAFVNWSELALAQELWEGVVENLFEPLGYPPWMFFDLSDCGNKTPEEMRRLARLMRRCGRAGRVVLSLNENERNAFGAALLGDAPVTGEALRDNLGAWAVVFHLLRETHAFGGEGVFRFRNHVIARPRISTGGGDNFNAGLCAGLLGGLSLRHAAMLASLCGSRYVEHGSCASAEEILSYARKHALPEIP